jgi:isopenicillin N synthase-like dioxygenase
VKVSKVNYQSKTAAKQFVTSLRQTGFAVVTNHFVRPELLEDVYEEWADFFSTDNKYRYPKTDRHSGFFPLKSENAKDSQVKDLKEFFHLYNLADMPAEIMSASTMVLRDKLVEHASQMLSWVQQETPELQLATLSEPFPKMIKDSDRTLFRVLHYPPVPEDTEPGAVRAAAHGDINLLTILPAATQPGLQVQDTQGNWHDVECDPGSLVVDAGDMLSYATGGHYPSTVHRVVNPTDSPNVSRYSLPLFLHPRPEVDLGAGFTAGAYLSQRLKELGLA